MIVAFSVGWLYTYCFLLCLFFIVHNIIALDFLVSHRHFSLVIISRIWCGYDCAFSNSVSLFLLSHHKHGIAWRGYLSYHTSLYFSRPSIHSQMYAALPIEHSRIAATHLDCTRLLRATMQATLVVYQPAQLATFIQYNHRSSPSYSSLSTATTRTCISPNSKKKPSIPCPRSVAVNSKFPPPLVYPRSSYNDVA